jgi:hypothetical protein
VKRGTKMSAGQTPEQYWICDNTGAIMTGTEPNDAREVPEQEIVDKLNFHHSQENKRIKEAVNVLKTLEYSSPRQDKYTVEQAIKILENKYEDDGLVF